MAGRAGYAPRKRAAKEPWHDSNPFLGARYLVATRYLCAADVQSESQMSGRARQVQMSAWSWPLCAWPTACGAGQQRPTPRAGWGARRLPPQCRPQRRAGHDEVLTGNQASELSEVRPSQSGRKATL